MSNCIALVASNVLAKSETVRLFKEESSRQPLPQPECQCYCSYIITCVVKIQLTLVLTSALILAGTAANSGDSAYAVRLSTLFISGLVEAAHASLLLSDMSLANT